VPLTYHPCFVPRGRVLAVILNTDDKSRRRPGMTQELVMALARPLMPGHLAARRQALVGTEESLKNA
jgi:hypothetical protein